MLPGGGRLICNIYVARVSWVGSVLYIPCTAPQNGKLGSRSWSIWSVRRVKCFYTGMHRTVYTAAVLCCRKANRVRVVIVILQALAFFFGAERRSVVHELFYALEIARCFAGFICGNGRLFTLFCHVCMYRVCIIGRSIIYRTPTSKSGLAVSFW